MNVQVAVFWVMTQRCFVVEYQRSAEPWCRTQNMKLLFILVLKLRVIHFSLQLVLTISFFKKK